MRKYIRHPSDIPIEFNINFIPEEQKDLLNNISNGGLSFNSKVELDVGTVIKIRIPIVKPVFEATGNVVWCTEIGNNYEIGIEIIGKEQAFRTRMVEQVCHIEHYKREVFKSEGRVLSGMEAALEWIAKYAHIFPNNDSESGR